MEKQADKEIEGKKGDDDKPGVAETLLEPRGDADPDVRDQAEYAVRSFVAQCMEDFARSVADAADQVRDALASESDRVYYDQYGFLEQLGDTFLREIASLGHGPIMNAMVSYMSDIVDNALKGASLDTFISAAITEAGAWGSWYVRDNVDALCGDKWSAIVKLAVEEDDYTGALHKQGLPRMFLEASRLSSPLIHLAHEHKRAARRTEQEMTGDEKKPDGADQAKSAEKELAKEEVRRELEESAAV